MTGSYTFSRPVSFNHKKNGIQVKATFSSSNFEVSPGIPASLFLPDLTWIHLLHRLTIQGRGTAGADLGSQRRKCTANGTCLEYGHAHDLALLALTSIHINPSAVVLHSSHFIARASQAAILHLFSSTRYCCCKIGAESEVVCFSRTRLLRRGIKGAHKHLIICERQTCHDFPLLACVDLSPTHASAWPLTDELMSASGSRTTPASNIHSVFQLPHLTSRPDHRYPN